MMKGKMIHNSSSCKCWCNGLMGSVLLCNETQYNGIILYDHCNGNPRFLNEFGSCGCTSQLHFIIMHDSDCSVQGEMNEKTKQNKNPPERIKGLYYKHKVKHN